MTDSPESTVPDQNYLLSGGVPIPRLGLGTWFIAEEHSAFPVFSGK